MADLATIASDPTVWHQVQAPRHYLADQWPIRIAVISPDRRYIAIAGHRGLAHYSLHSGRWRTFSDPEEQESFSVHGGMCWHKHILIAAVETSNETFEIRLYSRELALESGRILQTVPIESQVVSLSTTGEDGILVYSYNNTLDHYTIDSSKKTNQLVKVGQFALHGIIRAPPRVRAVSWVLPDHQLENGDASQDVSTASVLFLVDGKLVLLQPSATEEGELKYDMRKIASNIEYFVLARDDPSIFASIAQSYSGNPVDASELGLEDSLWAFDGECFKVWPDVHDLLSLAVNEQAQFTDAAIVIPLDFYPITTPLAKGLLVGVEAELTQRRDVNLSYFRIVARTSLFLPPVLRYYLTYYDISAAQRLCTRFQSLPYFSHGLEVLLHTVLDEEVEKPLSTGIAPKSPAWTEDSGDGGSLQTPAASLLPTVLSFLSNFPDYLDIILQCTRKTELRSWRTLFAHLPPPAQLFDAALQGGKLKTAGGYLLLLQQSQDDAEITSPNTSPDSSVPLGAIPIPSSNGNNAHTFVVSQAVRLLRRAQTVGDWDLCKELARFLMALDESGDTLRRAMEAVDSGGDVDNNDDESTPVSKTDLENGLALMNFGEERRSQAHR